MLESWVELQALARGYSREVLELSAAARLERQHAVATRKHVIRTDGLRFWLGRRLVAMGTRMQKPVVETPDTRGGVLRRAS